MEYLFYVDLELQSLQLLLVKLRVSSSTDMNNHMVIFSIEG